MGLQIDRTVNLSTVGSWASMLIAITAFFISLDGRVSVLETKTDKHDAVITSMQAPNAMLPGANRDIAVIKTQVEQNARSIQRIRIESKEQIQEIKVILRDIRGQTR